jgi:hypothetical protein
MPSDRNIKLLFAARIIRLFAYGFLSIVLVLYLAKTGLTEGKIGLLMSCTLIGDAGAHCSWFWLVLYLS